ncbi:hypothetical protein ABW21_db0202135 [Orbilia brochopaga]|nr:hypothetical protein ABW21_db0202135 [Drechslerella brochopaga]
MKFSAVLLVASAAAVSAIGIADIPQCAQTCLISALSATGCDLTDFKCSCTNEKFVNDGASCIDKACGDADIKKSRDATIGICSAAGVSINPPSKGGDKPTTSAAAPATTSAPAPVSSSVAAPVVSSSAAAVAPVVSSSVVAPGYGASVTTKTTSRVAAPSVAPGNGTVSQPPAPTYTGAAAAIAGNAVLAIGGAVAAFFL